MANTNYSSYIPNTSAHLANALQQFFSNMLLSINTLLPCTILTVNSGTSVTYDIQSLVNIQDVNGVITSPPTIPSVPSYITQQNNCGLQLPSFAIGDIVLVGFFQRDCTSVIASNWTKQNAGSFRKFSWSDAIIIAKIDTGVTPTYSIKFETDGTITVIGTTVNVNAANVNLGNGATQGIVLGNATIKVEGIQTGSDTVFGTIETGVSTTVKAAS